MRDRWDINLIRDGEPIAFADLQYPSEPRRE
jgi:hypothetical protein